MNDAVNVETQSDEEALASMLSGYNGARGDEPPATVAKEEENNEQPNIEPVHESENLTQQAQPDLSVADELKALKLKVSALASSVEPEIVRKMHGEIGEINRTIKQMQAPAKEAPAEEDELAAALESAEEIANEFPEIGTPLLKALRAMSKKVSSQEPLDIDGIVSKKFASYTEQTAVDQILEEHSDFFEVKESPEFLKWKASKSPEFQTRFNNSWNPAVVGKGISEFKAAQIDQRKREEEQQRRDKKLASAITPQGNQQKSKPSTLSDDEAFHVGYNKGMKRTY